MYEIRAQIMEKLRLIEAEHGVKIPLAVESGSRAWGFASPDSDYDCRFVYVRPESEYLSVFERKDTIDYTPDAVFDLGGWDLKKFIQHLVKSSAVALEWLQSNEIYRREDAVADRLRELGQAFFNPVSTSWHYLSMAKKKLADIEAKNAAKIKTYFYVMRPLACARFIREQGGVPSMEYRRNLEVIDVPARIRDELDMLMLKKERAGESELLSQNHILIDYFKQELDETELWLKAARQEKNQNYEQADICFLEIVRMVNNYD